MVNLQVLSLRATPLLQGLRASRTQVPHGSWVCHQSPRPPPWSCSSGPGGSGGPRASPSSASAPSGQWSHPFRHHTCRSKAGRWWGMAMARTKGHLLIYQMYNAFGLIYWKNDSKDSFLAVPTWVTALERSPLSPPTPLGLCGIWLKVGLVLQECFHVFQLLN